MSNAPAQAIRTLVRASTARLTSAVINSSLGPSTGMSADTRFTLAAAVVLAVISSEVVRHADCRLCLDHIAAVAGVSRSTAKNALRSVRTLDLLTVEERAQTAWRNLSNVVRIVSKEWTSWMRLACRAPSPGEGVKP